MQTAPPETAVTDIDGLASSDIKVEFKMPKEAEVGSSIELRCEWRIMSGSNLYSVKWYKDDHEFFRYVPDSSQRTQTFPRPGVTVEEDKTDTMRSQMLLISLLEIQRFELAIFKHRQEWNPYFSYILNNKITPPERGPEITGLSLHYAVGENVTANCTAWPSVPKANLRWTINGEPVKYLSTFPVLVNFPVCRIDVLH
ncbi:hypothetical protein ALC53_07461 [Atta colombica]|uniref:Ig-like domain-containing protein n=1 Tax=Atta colombica TaxID=520822 RepID=A0A195BCY1_9HYME|nr:hypothetical protein ALC53_07461 [Atta colombica]